MSSGPPGAVWTCFQLPGWRLFGIQRSVQLDLSFSWSFVAPRKWHSWLAATSSARLLLTYLRLSRHFVIIVTNFLRICRYLQSDVRTAGRTMRTRTSKMASKFVASPASTAAKWHASPTPVARDLTGREGNAGWVELLGLARGTTEPATAFSTMISPGTVQVSAVMDCVA